MLVFQIDVIACVHGIYCHYVAHLNDSWTQVEELQNPIWLFGVDISVTAFGSVGETRDLDSIKI